MSDFERALVELVRQHRAATAPASVETAVLNAFDARRGRVVRMRIGAVGAIAAALAAGIFLTVPRERAAALQITPLPQVVVVPAIEPLPQKRVVRRQIVASEQPFMAIPYTVPFAPGEEATIVRMTLSPAALAAVGVPLPAIDPASETQADVLVGFDGRARAIRLIASSGANQ